MNVAKCSTMTFTLKIDPLVSNSQLDCISLSRSDTVCDFGIKFNLKLAFSNHINNITTDEATLKSFYYFYVRS